MNSHSFVILDTSGRDDKPAALVPAICFCMREIETVYLVGGATCAAKHETHIFRSPLMSRASIRPQVVRVLLQELSTARKGGVVGVDSAYMMPLLKGKGRCAAF